MRGEVWRRSSGLVSAVLGELREEVDDGVELPALLEVVGSHDRWSPKTIRNTIADLESFGALRLSSPRGASRRVFVTVLGEAWCQGVGLPVLGSRDLAVAVEDLFESELVELGELGEDVEELDGVHGFGEGE